MATQNQVTIYLTEDRLKKVAAVQSELSRRAGIAISRNAAICRAIDDLFLSLCLSNKTEDIREGQIDSEGKH